MKIEINVVGQRADWNAELADISKRLDEIGSNARHKDLYAALGLENGSVIFHGADDEFSFRCEGFEKFIKEYIHPATGTKEEAEARARELLVRIDDWLRGLERAAKRFSISVEYPQREESCE